MRPTTLERNSISADTVELVGRLISLIPSPIRRGAMGDVTLTLLDGKKRAAEEIFGWSRNAVELGMHEHQTGIICVNDIAARRKPRTEDKHPKLLAEIQAIMEPHSQSEASLRTTLLYSNITAKAVHEALIQNGWSEQFLPTERTISNLLNRQDYRLRTVAKSKVQKKQVKLTPSLKT
jgi:Rhodopirellula transposase DDE domain